PPAASRRTRPKQTGAPSCRALQAADETRTTARAGLLVATLGRIARQLRANVRIRIAPDVTTGNVVYGPALDQRPPAKGIGIVRGRRRRTVQTVGAILRGRL